MDFKKLIGKQVKWTGQDVDEEGNTVGYILFEDNVGIAIKEPDEAVTILSDASDTLKTVLGDKLEEAQNFQALAELLNTPDKVTYPITETVEEIPVIGVVGEPANG